MNDEEERKNVPSPRAPVHTPGPWVVVAHPGGTRRRGDAVVAPESPDRFGDVTVGYAGPLVAETLTPEDARLIAAAPEMLAALEGVEKWRTDLGDLLEFSTSWIHDSTEWASNENLGPKWQALWNAWPNVKALISKARGNE